jgi:hypothetical protein
MGFHWSVQVPWLGCFSENTLEMVNAATGFGYRDVGALSETGERIDNLTRAFNVRECRLTVCSTNTTDIAVGMSRDYPAKRN